MVGAAAPRLTLSRAVARACGAALAALAAAALGQSPDDAWRVTGQCRDGQPQGGYALHGGDGQVRVQGAFNQGQRTGSFFFWSRTGARIAQLPFDADALSGTLSLWYESNARGAEPARRLEAPYRNGRRDGLTRGWYQSGRLRAEVEYDAGVMVAARGWSETGEALEASAARMAAEREQADTERYVAALIATVRRHPPDCHPAPPAQRAQARPSILSLPPRSEA